MNESQGNAVAGESLSNSLLQVNKMLYKMPPSLGITARRHHVIDFSQQNAYNAGQTMVFDLQTGSYFIDGKNSYLKLTMKPDADITSTTRLFGSGGATNLIKRVVVRTKSGKEWSRCEEYNLYAKATLRYSCPEMYLNYVANSYSFTDTNDNIPKTATALQGLTFTIPMWLLAGCFNQDKLLPPQIMEGLRIEITLASFGEAIADNGGSGATTYVVSNAEIHSDAFDIADQFKRKVAEMSARQGLVLVHKEYFHSNVGTISPSNQYNFDIKKACSKACRSFTIMRPPANLDDPTLDSMNSEVYNVSRYQAHIGQDYLPNQPISVPATQGGGVVALRDVNEAYYDTQFVWDKVNQCWYSNSVRPIKFLGAQEDGTAIADKDGQVAFNLNKSHVTDLDGYVLNNSRALVIDIQTHLSAQRKLDTYLQHLRVAKVYTANAEIRD